jgi:acyl carrier protein
VAPRSELERRLAEIWQELLRVEEVGVRDSFLDLGGHSLLATQLLSRLREDFGVRISLEQLFADGTVAGLATTVETLQWAARSAQPVRVAEGDRDEGEI